MNETRSGARRRINAAACAAMLAAVAAAPYPYGAVLPGAILRIEILAFLAAAAALISRPGDLRLRGAAAPIAFLCAITALGVLQIAPLGNELVRTLSPMSAKIYHETSELFRVFGRKDAPAAKISIAPADTLRVILLTLADLALFLAAALTLRRRTRRRIFAAVVLGGAVAAVAVAATQNDVAAERLHGPFINPDHFAGYLEISLALAFGVIWTEILTGGDRTRDLPDRAARVEKRILPLSAGILLWGFLAAGIVLTRSRGGILAGAVSTVALITIGLWRQRRQGRATKVLSTTLAILLGVAFVAGATKREALLRFLASDPRDMGADLRVQIWKASLQASREFPLVGSGLGSFKEAFRRVQPRGMEGLVEHAHDDALQMLVTGGWAGLVLGVLLYGTLFAALLRALRRQRHREESAFVLAGIGALLSLAIHGLVDFNMSIPAIPATLAAVLGAAWAAGQRGANRGSTIDD
jgi:O-antigen ligase